MSETKQIIYFSIFIIFVWPVSFWFVARPISLIGHFITGVDIWEKAYEGSWQGSLLMDIIYGTLLLTLIFACEMERRK